MQFKRKGKQFHRKLACRYNRNQHAVRVEYAEEIQIDWGSYAWKGCKADILKLKREWHAKLEDETSLKEDVEYGVVFIEES